MWTVLKLSQFIVSNLYTDKKMHENHWHTLTPKQPSCPSTTWSGEQTTRHTSPTKNHPQTVQALRSLRASLEERQSPDQTWDQIVLELELLSAITRVSTCINYTVHCYHYLGLFAKNSHSWYRAVITCALGSQNYIQWLRMRLWDVVRGPHKIAFVQKQGSRRLSARKFVIRMGDKS